MQTRDENFFYSIAIPPNLRILVGHLRKDELNMSSVLLPSLLASACTFTCSTSIALLLVINSFVFSKLQYCSTVWSNTSSSNIDKLQKVQNFAGRIILGLRKYDHISDGLRSLKWLPIREKLILNDATMMHKCINKLVPDYLADMFKSRSHVHNRQTRSSGAIIWSSYVFVSHACTQI